jgi:GNAT superfamily N-acetyltransferase
MILELIKATSSDAVSMLQMQIDSFSPLLEKYQDIETSPAMESLDKMLFRIQHQNGCYFKIMADGIHVGGLWVFEKSLKVYRIGIIYIAPTIQGKGIGGKALTIVEGLFPDADEWELDCPADMPMNRSCYEKLGYRFTGETQIINEKLTLVSYRKRITS